MDPEEWDSDTSVATTAADVSRLVAAYRTAARWAEQVRELLAAARQPHSERDVWPGLDIATGAPRVFVAVQGPAHHRACEAVLDVVLPDPETRSGSTTGCARGQRSVHAVSPAVPPSASA